MIQYTITSRETDNEILLALISDYAFNSFELIDHAVIAYLPDDKEQSTIDSGLNNLQSSFHFKYTKKKLEYQNWNKLWESNFTPVLVDDYCIIRADFHESQKGFEHEIIINPKMAFGTGHHETTFMMLQLMRELDLNGTEVFDYGAGTGVLSIMASYEGAKDIIALDIEEESYLNTIENSSANNVSNIKSNHGSLVDISTNSSFDVILANINRQVLLDSATILFQLCRSEATLLLSGILKVDIELVQNCYIDAGFKFIKMNQKGEWVAMKFMA